MFNKKQYLVFFAMPNKKKSISNASLGLNCAVTEVVHRVRVGHKTKTEHHL